MYLGRYLAQQGRQAGIHRVLSTVLVVLVGLDRYVRGVKAGGWRGRGYIRLGGPFQSGCFVADLHRLWGVLVHWSGALAVGVLVYIHGCAKWSMGGRLSLFF